jgi:hypothetical protein
MFILLRLKAKKCLLWYKKLKACVTILKEF